MLHCVIHLWKIVSSALAAITLLAAACSAGPGVPPDTGIYVQGGGGAGFAIMTSDELTELFGDEFGIGLGFHFSVSVAVGYENLLQVEIRRGDAAHTLRDNDIVTNESNEIPMDYDFTEYVFKANLFAISGSRRANKETALFLIAGTSDIEYLDESKDGFKGNGTVLGIEYTRFTPHGSVALGFRRYGIEFDRITLLGQTGQLRIDASNYVLHAAISFGFGI